MSALRRLLLVSRAHVQLPLLFTAMCKVWHLGLAVGTEISSRHTQAIAGKHLCVSKVHVNSPPGASLPAMCLMCAFVNCLCWPEMCGKLCRQDAIHCTDLLLLFQQGLKSLMNRLEMALRDASAQRGLSRTSSRRTSKEPATARQMSRTGSTRRRSMASPSNSLKQSREGFESNLAAERSALPAGLHWFIVVHCVAASPFFCFLVVTFLQGSLHLGSAIKLGIF